MIKISIRKDNDLYKEIIIKGHADYDSKGKDIVCSAVSSIVITTVNAILIFDENAINYNDNDMLRIEVLSNDNVTSKLLDNMIVLLKELADDYEKNIKFI